ncbi:ParB/RepB/Spo0J family partition protein [Aquimarina macrocephali]|uniref:ParB/RepB/Spo0J family partition protein n=1 Tax=Aquimarina macrocephali TaxID=666563 RepID=UPI0004AF93EF|nr:ParB/RepB/Spo0J family partition protein [Aquimarina macrocephali]
MIPLNQIKPSKNNPRKSFDDHTIAGLAASIKTDGLLQNLVVAKPKGKAKTYTIISGERRFRALSLLVANEDLPKDFDVPVKIEDGLTDEEMHRIATIENIQRENLSPLEEAAAVVGLLQDHMSLDDIVAQTGLSLSTIKRRLALSALCDEAKAALNNKEITLSQAEALTVGTQKQQVDLITQRNLSHFDVDDIKEYMTDDKACLSHALFDTKLYKGTFSSDLFGDDDTTFFDDMDAFWTLQNEAIQIREYELSLDGFAPIEIIERGYFSDWQYSQPEEDETGGAVIHVMPSGEVEIHKNLINRKLDEKAVELAEAKPRATYSKPICEYIAMHKSIAVQAALLENPRIAKELAIVQMLSRSNGIKLDLHNCLSYFDEEESQSNSFETIKTSIISVLATFKILDSDEIPYLIYSFFNNYRNSVTSLDYYIILKTLSNEELENMHSLLTILCFGQLQSDRLDTNEESLFNRVAQDLKVDMSECWIPDEPFLKRRNMSQLKEIISESKLSHLFGTGDGYKKGKLVKSMADNFKRIRSLEKPSANEQKAYDWTPEAFQFPAIDPDKIMPSE